MSAVNWKPITRKAIEAAKEFGHTLGSFSGQQRSPSVKTAMCETCYGCCWIAYSPTRGFGTGGRLLKYHCGTPEAAGLKGLKEFIGKHE